jgi:glutamine amidotransferase-like uncharacterized protein
MEFLLDEETPTLLKNDDFNVFMWPYNPDPGTYYEQFTSLNPTTGNAVRAFVNKGGGFIGSCYGAFAASSGFLQPVPVIALRPAYLSYLPSKRPTFSMSDTLMAIPLVGKDTLYRSTAAILDNDHPVTYGISHTVTEFFKGPWFVWLGENTKTISVYTDLHDLNEETTQCDILRDNIVGTPTWVETTFGDGKLVLFSSHPEFVNNISLLIEGIEWPGDPYYGRRVIHNSLHYVTSHPIHNVLPTTSYPITYLESLY